MSAGLFGQNHASRDRRNPGDWNAGEEDKHTLVLRLPDNYPAEYLRPRDVDLSIEIGDETLTDDASVSVGENGVEITLPTSALWPGTMAVDVSIPKPSALLQTLYVDGEFLHELDFEDALETYLTLEEQDVSESFVVDVVY